MSKRQNQDNFSKWTRTSKQVLWYLLTNKYTHSGINWRLYYYIYYNFQLAAYWKLNNLYLLKNQLCYSSSPWQMGVMAIKSFNQHHSGCKIFFHYISDINIRRMVLVHVTISGQFPPQRSLCTHIIKQIREVLIIISVQ